MAHTFLKSDGDIREVLRTMFHSPEFWSREAYRAKMKTPLEFVVSAARATGAKVQNAMPLVQALNRLGMPLYGSQPPTGYSTKAEAWTNSAALLARMNLALALASGRLPGSAIDPQQLMTAYHLEKHRKVESQPVTTDDADALLRQLESALLEGGVSQQTHDALRQQMESSLQGIEFRTAASSERAQATMMPVMTGLILGSPEFQRR
jgi:hypothetical protein